MKEIKWFSVFKTGRHTDSAGNTREWSDADLDKIVNSYDPSEHEAPIVIGHPATNAPAYGWIEKLKRIGDTLYAMPKQVVKEFREMVKQGLFKKRSISLYPDGTLRHVGFLGAVPPAVKGLADAEFKDQPDLPDGTRDIIVEFAREDDFNENEEDEGTNPAPIESGQDRMGTIENEEDEGTNPAPIESGQDRMGTIPQGSTAEELERTKEELKREKIERKKAEEAYAEMQQRFDELQFNDFFSRNVSEGKLLPKSAPIIKKLWDATIPEGREGREFSHGGKAEAPRSLLVQFVESLPKAIDLSERITPIEEKEKNTSAMKIITEEIKRKMNH